MSNSVLDKCPACGAIRSSFSATCPECGYEFKNISTNKSFAEFTQQLTEVDNEISQREYTNSKVGFGTILLWIFFFPIMLIIKFVKFTFNSMSPDKLTGAELRKSQLINNYPIPNSCEDLLEFSMFIGNQVKSVNWIGALTKTGAETQQWNKVWEQKLNQIDQKAALALRDDRSSMDKIKTIETNVAGTIKENNTKITAVVVVGLIAVIAFFVLANLS